MFASVSLSRLSSHHVFCSNHWRVRTDLTRDACLAGYYCPAGAESPESCPSGTYNPHTGRDDLEDCLVSPEGFYTIEASTNMTGPCAPGYYCPSGSTGPEQVSLKFKQYTPYVNVEERECRLFPFVPFRGVEPPHNVVHERHETGHDQDFSGGIPGAAAREVPKRQRALKCYTRSPCDESARTLARKSSAKTRRIVPLWGKL